jgi:hypothetical protein
MKLPIHLHPVPRSKNEWSYTSTPNTPYWRGAQLEHRENFTFYLFHKNIIKCECLRVGRPRYRWEEKSIKKTALTDKTDNYV